ncbi:MAG: hypothetical protein R2695_15905 [Acidimicrobiales bacterium]
MGFVRRPHLKFNEDLLPRDLQQLVEAGNAARITAHHRRHAGHHQRRGCPARLP